MDAARFNASGVRCSGKLFAFAAQPISLFQDYLLRSMLATDQRPLPSLTMDLFVEMTTLRTYAIIPIQRTAWDAH